MNQIVIIADWQNESLTAETYAAIREASTLCATLQAGLSLAAINPTEKIQEQMVQIGVVKNIITCKIKDYLTYSPIVHAMLLAQLFLDIEPAIMLIPSSIRGNEYGALLSQKLDVPFVTDCIHLQPGEGGDFLITKPTHSGIVNVVLRCPIARKCIVTITSSDEDGFISFAG